MLRIRELGPFYTSQPSSEGVSPYTRETSPVSPVAILTKQDSYELPVTLSSPWTTENVPELKQK